MARYTKSNKIKNSSKYYEPLRKSRGLKSVTQYATPTLYNPDVKGRRKVETTKHLWKYGARLYKLACQYDGDQRYWWLIASRHVQPLENDFWLF